ncbi:hypothetical protein NDU88_008455 [Pleurodeles waltl]|uniref:Uncharacterized protein n=1 Tax=Pleurodeles waltl TaxID=8319 RepID=A0AAV7PT68_PLEWA|nr:hypothetical protein NDU88_008455 [Pleurodeles waltl]
MPDPFLCYDLLMCSYIPLNTRLRAPTLVPDTRSRGALLILSLAVPLAPTAPTTLLVFPPFVDEDEERRVIALSGSRDSFPGALPVLTLPGFPRRGILAEPFLTRRSSSAAQPQGRSLPPSTSPGAWICRVSEFQGVREAERAAERHTRAHCRLRVPRPPARREVRLASYDRYATRHVPLRKQNGV